MDACTSTPADLQAHAHHRQSARDHAAASGVPRFSSIDEVHCCWTAACRPLADVCRACALSSKVGLPGAGQAGYPPTVPLPASIKKVADGDVWSPHPLCLQDVTVP